MSDCFTVMNKDVSVTLNGKPVDCRETAPGVWVAGKVKAEDKSQDDGSRKPVRVIASRKTPDSRGDTIGDYMSTRSRIPVLHGHDHAKWPLGRVTNMSVDGDSLFADLSFFPTPEAQDAEERMRKGYITDVSIGFIPRGNVALNKSGGLHFDKADIFEISPVAIGAHPDAKVVRNLIMKTIFTDNGKNDVNDIDPVTMDVPDELRQMVRDAVEEKLKPLTANRQPQWMNKLKGEIKHSQGPTPLKYGRTRERDRKPGDLFMDTTQRYWNEGIDSCEKWLQENGLGSIVKTVAAGDATAGGFMLRDEVFNDFIDLLRAQSVVRQINPRIVTLERGTGKFDKLTGSASASWLGEGQQIAESSPTFGEIRLTARKLSGIVRFNNEWLRWGGDRDIIRGDLVSVMAEEEDKAFLRADGTQDKPKGLRHWADAANVSASLGNTAANIEGDFKSMMLDLTGKNVSLNGAWWLMSERELNSLLTLRESAGGNLVFPEVRSERPSVFRLPIATTNNLPINLGAGSDESEVYLVAGPQVVVGQSDGVIVDFSTDGTVMDSGGATISLFQHDQSAIRTILHVDLTVRHPEAVAVRTGVRWGA